MVMVVFVESVKLALSFRLDTPCSSRAFSSLASACSKTSLIVLFSDLGDNGGSEAATGGAFGICDVESAGVSGLSGVADCKLSRGVDTGAAGDREPLRSMRSLLASDLAAC